MSLSSGETLVSQTLKTFQKYEKKTSKPYSVFLSGNKKTSANHETNFNPNLYHRSAG
jgi:hypothetical protein